MATSCIDKIQSRKADLNNRAMNLKAYQTPKHCTAVYNNDEGFYNSGKLSPHHHSILCHRDSQVISRITPFTLHANVRWCCIGLGQKSSRVQHFCQITLFAGAAAAPLQWSRWNEWGHCFFFYEHSFRILLTWHLKTMNFQKSTLLHDDKPLSPV